MLFALAPFDDPMATNDKARRDTTMQQILRQGRAGQGRIGQRAGSGPVRVWLPAAAAAAAAAGPCRCMPLMLLHRQQQGPAFTLRVSGMQYTRSQRRQPPCPSCQPVGRPPRTPPALALLPPPSPPHPHPHPSPLSRTHARTPQGRMDGAGQHPRHPRVPRPAAGHPALEPRGALQPVGHHAAPLVQRRPAAGRAHHEHRAGAAADRHAAAVRAVGRGGQSVAPPLQYSSMVYCKVLHSTDQSPRRRRPVQAEDGLWLACVGALARSAALPQHGVLRHDVFPMCARCFLAFLRACFGPAAPPFFGRWLPHTGPLPSTRPTTTR